jgi:2-phosphoglycerate kinase
LRAYKTQCRAVQRGVEGVLARAIHENLPLIIEGVHLIPGKLELSPVYQQEKENITQYLVHIRNPKVHQERFKQRQHDAPRRKREQYLANFREIRWIHDYLLRKAAHCQRVHVIDNSGSVRESIDTMVRAHYTEKTLV